MNPQVNQPMNLMAALSGLVGQANAQSLTEKKPSLRVMGNKLIDQATGKPVMFKGVTSDAFRDQKFNGNAPSADSTINRLSQTKQWGSNAVQLYLDPRTFQNSKRWQDLDKVVTWANKNNMYVVLNPVNDDPYTGKGQTMYVDSLMPNFLSSLASRYKSNGNVMYGLEAEPKNVDPNAANSRIQQIQSQAPNAPIMVQASGYGQYPSDFFNSNSNKNLVYSLGGYANENSSSDTGSTQNLPTQALKTGKYKKYPAVISEFGGYWGGDYGSPKDLNYFKDVAQTAQKSNTPYFAYSIDQSEPGLSLFDQSGKVTPRGNIVKSIMSQK